MTGIEHPIKVKIENINFGLKDKAGKEINENIKSGEELTISKATINRLTILEELIPNEYALEQNYPNPFNSITTIKFRVPKLGFVTLKVYDVLENEIATSDNEKKSIVIFEIKLDAAGLPSGIYFYRLRTGSFIETKKVVLLY